MKKKERTDLEKIRRGKIALGFIAVMAAFVLVQSLGHRRTEPVDPITHLLDSVVRADYPEGTTVIYRSYVETVEETHPIEDSLAKARVEYKKAINRMTLTKKLDTAYTRILRKKIHTLERQADSARRSGPAPTHIVQAIRLRRPDGVEMSAYLWMEPDMSSAKIIHNGIYRGPETDSLAADAALSMEKQIIEKENNKDNQHHENNYLLQ